MIKVYTKTGDGGTTSLIGGERVSKADLRVEAYGTVDELAAHLALFADMMRQTAARQPQLPCSAEVEMSAADSLSRIAAAIDDIQKDLMVVEAMLATGKGAEGKIAPLPESAIKRLEDQIDTMSEGLPPIKGFTLPGGDPIVSQSHVCRTVCRRAERLTVEVIRQYAAPPAVGEYLNRLSDWLYVAGRKIIGVLNVKEIYWIH